MRLEFESNPVSLPVVDNDDVNEMISDDNSPEVTSMLKDGIKAAQSGDRAEARAILLRVTEADVENENAWLWLASISEYPEELLVFLKNVLAINPNNQRAIEWAKATESLMAKTFVQRGIDASKNEQKSVAKQCFLQAIVHDNESELAWLWLASVTDSSEEKVSHLQKVLKINPNNENAISSLKNAKTHTAKSLMPKANEAAIKGNRKDAQQLLDEILSDAPEFEDAWMLKAHLADGFEEKIGYFEQVLEVNPENQVAKANLESLKTFVSQSDEEKEVESSEESSEMSMDAPELEIALDESVQEIEVESSKDEIELEVEASTEVELQNLGSENVQEAESEQDFETLEAESEQDFETLDAESEQDIEKLEVDSEEDEQEIIEELFEALEAGPIQELSDEAEELNVEPIEVQTEVEDEPVALEDDFLLSEAEFDEAEHNQNLHEEYSEQLEDEEEESPAAEVLEAVEENPLVEASAEEDQDEEDQDNESNLVAEYNDKEASDSDEKEIQQLESAETEELEPLDLETSDELDSQEVDSQEVETQVCPFCEEQNEHQAFACSSCKAVLSLSDMEMILLQDDADAETIKESVTQMELDKNEDGFDVEQLKYLGIGYINLKEYRKGFECLQEASKQDHNDVVLSSQLDVLAVRISEIEKQEEDFDAQPKSKTILVVDDSPTVRKLISGKLEKSGHEAVCAVDGMDALAKINEVIPDLILLDITMPRMDGYQVCKLIRGNEATQEVPIVMISGKDGFFDKVRGKMAGTNSYITKPFGPETLMKMVNEYIS